MPQESAAPIKPVAFTVAFIGLAVALAQVDGEPSEEEYMALRGLFPWEACYSRAVRSLFRQMQQSRTPIYAYARFLRTCYPTNKELHLRVIRALCELAAVDRKISAAERKMLEMVAEAFGIHPAELEEQMREVAEAGDPFRILGVEPGASEYTIKQSYRRLMRACHPDYLIRPGLPEDIIALASRRTAALNDAYHVIMRRNRRPLPVWRRVQEMVAGA